MKEKIIIVVLLLWCCACGQQERKAEYQVVNLEALAETDCSVKLSDIADSIRYVALDTNGNCFLEGNCSVAGVTDDYFYIASLRKVYQFNQQGKFVRIIGTNGRGSTEYSSVHKVRFFNDKIYVLTWSGEVVVYASDGDFLQRIRLPQGIINGFELINDSMYVAEEKIYKDKKMKLYLNIFKDEQRIRQRVIQEDNSEVMSDFNNSGEFYRSGGDVFYRNLYQDTLYRIGKDGEIAPAKLFTYGKYTPDRNMWENLKRRKEATQSGYIFGQMYFEARDYSFIWSVLYGKDYLTIYDNAKHQIIYNQQAKRHPLRENAGIEDDLTHMGTCFWPAFVDGEKDRLVNLTNPCHFSDETIRHFQQLGIQINDDSNPVVAICYLKK